MDLYKNIKARRVELGLTQSELAAKLGYADKSMIAKIEKGAIDLPLSKIDAFAEALRTTSGTIMGFDDPEEIIVDMFNQEEDERLAFIIKAYQNAEESDRRLIYAAAIVAAGEEYHG